MGLVKKLLILTALTFIPYHLFRIIYRFGFHKTVYNHSPGPCFAVPGVEEGSEDIYTLTDGIAIISSGLKWGASLTNPLYNKRKGRFLMFDFNNVEAGVSEIPIGGVRVNNPHGIGVWEDEHQVIVFVVNHDNGKEQVVQLEFDRSRKTLQHIKTISDPLLTFLNDVVPTGPNSFYVTNFCGSSHAFHTMEMVLQLKWANIVHFDGARVKIAAEALVSPNGINLSPDGKFAYVASSMNWEFMVFKRLFDNRLELYKSIPLNSLPDNIDVDKETGDAWIGCQPITYDSVQHLHDPTKKCSAQVLRLKMKDGDVTHIEEVYSEDDQLLHCATVASYYKGAMLIGSIMQKLAYCKVNHLH